MSTIINGGTTADPTLTVRVGLPTDAAAGNTIQLYQSGVALGNPVAITATDITNTYKDISTPALADAAYPFNATIINAGGASPHSVANYTVTVSGGGGSGGGLGGGGATLLFEENFNTLDLATSGNPNGLWRPNDFWQSITRGYEDFAGNSYNVNPNSPAFAAYNPFSVSGGILTITSTRVPAGLVSTIRAEMDAQQQFNAVPNWMGGILITNPSVRTFLYGYFEFLVRWPNQGKGLFPALWFYNAMGGPKTTAEIDLLEMFGIPNRWTSSIHGSASVEVGSASEDTTGWHTYALDWQPTYLRFYRDNVLKWQLTGAQAEWFDQPMKILINFSMDAPWFPTSSMSDGTSPSPMRMEVDYIKVWDTKP